MRDRDEEWMMLDSTSLKQLEKTPVDNNFILKCTQSKALIFLTNLAKSRIKVKMGEKGYSASKYKCFIREMMKMIMTEK